jgi:hypothetical protein
MRAKYPQRFNELDSARGELNLRHNGSLLLDEIADFGLDPQSKLLQFLQDGRFSMSHDCGYRVCASEAKTYLSWLSIFGHACRRNSVRNPNPLESEPLSVDTCRNRIGPGIFASFRMALPATS